jgi:glutaredoxin-like protein NrdH
MDESKIKHMDGEDRGKIMLFALSTCMWCGKTKQLLDSLGVAYDWIDVDLVGSADQPELTQEIKKWNPATTFPTVVIDDDKCIIGYNPEELQAEIEKRV